jgi:hypothetical protein
VHDVILMIGYPMNSGIPHARLCGARTRRGSPCARRSGRSGRCHLHGDKSLAWFAHPNYQHGRYSKYAPERIFERAARQRRAIRRDYERLVAKLPAGTVLTGAQIHALFQIVLEQHRRRGWFRPQPRTCRIEAFAQHEAQQRAERSGASAKV